MAVGGYQNRVFERKVADGLLVVFVGREPLGPNGKLQWHLSMSHRFHDAIRSLGESRVGRIPDWEEIKEARYRFCPDEVYMAMILPPKSEYVNLHPTTMHLHEV